MQGNRQYLSLVEAGTSSPSFEWVERACEAMGITMLDLFSCDGSNHYRRLSRSAMSPGLAEFLASRDVNGSKVKRLTEEEIDILCSLGSSSDWSPSAYFYELMLGDMRHADAVAKPTDEPLAKTEGA